MEITRVDYTLGDKTDSTFLAECSVIFDDVFIVHKIILRRSAISGDVYLSMPSHSKTFSPSTGKYMFKDTAHPLNGDFRRELTESLLRGFNQCVENETRSYFPQKAD